MILIDQPRSYSKKPSGKKFCHLWSDDRLMLHDMARALGVRSHFFHVNPFPHYDLNEIQFERAREIGIPVVSSRELVKKARDT